MTAKFKVTQGGFELTPEDKELLAVQKALTRTVNEKFVQVGAVFLKPASKFPIDDDWHKRLRGDVDLQGWIDAEDLQPLNVGFNLQQGWLDVDIDADDPRFNQCVLAALKHLGVDTRFAFGRRSVGVPTHLFCQLSEEESANFDQLRRFEPKEFRFNNKRYHVQLRTFPTVGSDAKTLNRSAKQTVVPGSLYIPKSVGAEEYDISVWYGQQPGEIASSIASIASTSARKVAFSHIVQAVAFGTILYMLEPHWVEGQRQNTAQKVTGWLARVIAEGAGINNHEVLACEVWCPIDTVDVAKSLLEFICKEMGDNEPRMRTQALFDAMDKLERNPDAKIPGWASMQELVGGEAIQAIRTVVLPGNDVSALTKLIDRYIYDETDNKYIDRNRHHAYSIYAHDGNELERRHKGDVVFANKKPREAFKLFEASTLRKRVGFRDMFPELEPGQIYRVDFMGNVIPDESPSSAMVVYNTWKGWAINPAITRDEDRIKYLVGMLDRVLGYMTQDNEAQIDWVKKWIAWIFKHPGIKQQIAWVVMGGQGVGKSFMGNVFMRAMLTERLWGSASSSLMDGKFIIGPFKDKLFVFVDEANFAKSPQAVDEIKKLIRNTDISGMEKFEEARAYRVFSRLMFASNRYNVHISDRDTRDRALFYTKAYDEEFLGMSEAEFRDWAVELKPFFDEFSDALKDEDNISQLMRYFIDMDFTRHELEDIKLSSSNDPKVVANNMSWARRIAKSIIESGWIAAEDLAWEVPFDKHDMARRVQMEAKELSMSNVRYEAVLDEFERAGVLDKLTSGYNGASKRGWRSKTRWGDALERYAVATNLELSPYREPDDEDRGPNNEQFGSLRKLRGYKASLSGKF